MVTGRVLTSRHIGTELAQSRAIYHYIIHFNTILHLVPFHRGFIGTISFLLRSLYRI